MRKYILKRLLQSVVILFFVAFIIYALMRCLPTSYIEAMARQKSMQAGSKSFEEWMEQLTVMYNMDGSIVSGYFKWLGQMLTGNFGDSWRWTVPVLQKFNDTVWLSFVMGLISFIFELLIAIPSGHYCCYKTVFQDGLCRFRHRAGGHLAADVLLCVAAEARVLGKAGMV